MSDLDIWRFRYKRAPHHIQALVTNFGVCLQVGGYVQQYTGGLVLASVRGAGHQVPYFQPERALVLVSSFLKGKLPPYVVEQ